MLYNPHDGCTQFGSCSPTRAITSPGHWGKSRNFPDQCQEAESSIPCMIFLVRQIRERTATTKNRRWSGIPRLLAFRVPRSAATCGPSSSLQSAAMSSCLSGIRGELSGYRPDMLLLPHYIRVRQKIDPSCVEVEGTRGWHHESCG